MAKSKKYEKIDKKILIYVDVFLIFVFIILDHLSKNIVITHLKGHPDKSLIPGILELSYLENTGAAFGLLKNEKSFFFMVTIIMTAAVLYILVKVPAKKYIIPGNIFLVMIVGGALGNLFDRAINDYVIDFIYIKIIKFPVFNVADIFISIGTVGIIFLLLFYYKEDDLNFFKFKEKKIREVD